MGDAIQRMTPWMIVALGGLIFLLAAWAWMTAPGLTG